MSQAFAQPTDVMPVTPKLRRPHFSAAAVKQFREDTADLRAGDNPQPAAPVAVETPVQPTVTPESTPDSQTQFVPVQSIPLPEGFLGVKQPEAETPVPSVDREALEAQFRAENDALKRELESLRSELSEARKLPDDLRRLQEEQELERILQENTAEFGSIDPADARRLLAPVLRSVREQASQTSKQTETRLQNLESELQKQVSDLKEREQLAKVKSLRDTVLKAHPDLEQLQKTAAYQQVMMSPVGDGSGIRIGQVVAAEFQQGNTDYVIKVLDQVKRQAQQDVASVASVSPSGTHVAPGIASEGSSDKLTPDQIAQYKFMVQSGQMSRNEFRDIMKKHREAR